MQKSEEQRPLLGLWVHATPHRDVTLPRFSKGVTPLKSFATNSLSYSSWVSS